MAEDGVEYSMEQKMASEIKKISGTHSVDIPLIDAELRHLWEDEASDQLGANSVPSTRVCTATLIVFAACNDLHITIYKTIESITADHALRVICLFADKDAKEASADITGFCRLIDDGKMHICCEQITITAGINDIAELASAAAELITPGLPVFLWWMCNSRIGSDSYEDLVSLADKVIFDSAIPAASDNAFRDMTSQMDLHKNISFQDLNWHRITNWREALARLFDQQQYNPYLSEIKNIEIHYPQNDTNGAYHSAYLAGWFQSRMGWRIQKSGMGNDGIRRIDMAKNAEAAVSIILNPDISDSQFTGNIGWLDMTCEDGTRIQLKYMPDAGTILSDTVHSDGRRSVYEYLFESLLIEEMISIELRKLAEDMIFCEALQSAKEMLA